MADYTAVDEAILARLKEGACDFGALWRGKAGEAAVEIGDSYRITDRRLQALRKRGLIHYRRRYWHLTAEESA